MSLSSKHHHIVALTTLFLTFTVALALSSCNRKTIYSHYEPVSLDGWDAEDYLYFDIDPIAADGIYSQRVGLRHNGDYPFMRFTIVVDQHVTPSGFHSVDTINIGLVDQDGNMTAQGINYHIFDFELRRLELHAGDSLHFSVHHIMTREVIPGISDVGITLVREDS